MLSVLAVIAAASLVMLVLVIIEHSRMSEYFSKATELREEIASLIRQKPAPVRDNIAPIKANTALVQEKVAGLQPYFGQTAEPALEAFAAAAGVNLEDFRKDFNETWSSDNSRNELGGRDRFYQSIRRKYAGGWDAGLEAFRKAYQPYFVEKLDNTNIDAVFLAALGLPRNMDNDPKKAMDYMWRMRSDMVDLLNKDNSKFRFQGEAASLGFDYKNNPSIEMIPAIIKNWDVVSDLCSRIAAVKVDSLSSFSIRNLKGEESGSYRVYHYTFAVHGSLAKIRELVKVLNDAVADRRMYVIRSIFIYADRDGAKDVFRARSAAAEQLRSNADGSGRDDAAVAVQAEPVVDSNVPYDKRPGYGSVLFGGKESCEAVFDVEYITLNKPDLN